MAPPVGTCLVITGLLLSLSVGNAQKFVNVDCTADSVGRYGGRTMLECVVRFRVKDANITVVTWKKEGADKPVVAFEDGSGAGPVKQPGFRFANESWSASNTNVSLLITRTDMSHAGKYTCTVITDRGFSTGSTTLRVTAKYNKPTIQRAVSSGGNAMACHSDGGYPRGRLRWVVDGTAWQQVIQTDARESEGGLFNLTSILTLTKDPPFTKFTCVVIDANGQEENQATFEVLNLQGQGSEQQTSPAKIVAPLVIIGSLIVGLLLLVLFFRRRSRQARRPSVLPLMRDPQVCRCELDAEQGAEEEMVDKCEEQPCLRE